jgi:hypothetical protein
MKFTFLTLRDDPNLAASRSLSSVLSDLFPSTPRVRNCWKRPTMFSIESLIWLAGCELRTPVTSKA